MKRENKALLYVLSFTWGLPFVLIGFLVLAFVRVFLNNKVLGYEIIAGRICIIWDGDLPGAVNLGLVYMLDKHIRSSVHIHTHEIGHSIQNALFGPFFIFVVALPSLIRAAFWDKYVARKIKKTGIRPDYDGIWFEGQATKFGETYVKQQVIEDIKMKILS